MNKLQKKYEAVAIMSDASRKIEQAMKLLDKEKLFDIQQDLYESRILLLSAFRKILKYKGKKCR